MLTSYIHNIRQHTYNNNKLHQTGVFWLDVPVQTPHPSILVHSKPLSCKMFKQIVSSSPVSIYDLSVLWGLSRQHRKIIKHPMRPSKKKKKKKTCGTGTRHSSAFDRGEASKVSSDGTEFCFCCLLPLSLPHLSWNEITHSPIISRPDLSCQQTHCSIFGVGRNELL